MKNNLIIRLRFYLWLNMHWPEKYRFKNPLHVWTSGPISLRSYYEALEHYKHGIEPPETLQELQEQEPDWDTVPF